MFSLSELKINTISQYRKIFIAVDICFRHIGIVTSNASKHLMHGEFSLVAALLSIIPFFFCPKADNNQQKVTGYDVTLYMSIISYIYSDIITN